MPDVDLDEYLSGDQRAALRPTYPRPGDVRYEDGSYGPGPRVDPFRGVPGERVMTARRDFPLKGPTPYLLRNA